MLASVLTRMGGGSERRHGGLVPAGGARPVRLPHRLLLARASSRPAQSRSRLDEQVRFRRKGLAQDRPRISMTRLIALLATVTTAIAADLTGGNSKLYIGGRPGQIMILDEATEKVIGE